MYIFLNCSWRWRKIWINAATISSTCFCIWKSSNKLKNKHQKMFCSCCIFLIWSSWNKSHLMNFWRWTCDQSFRDIWSCFAKSLFTNEHLRSAANSVCYERFVETVSSWTHNAWFWLTATQQSDLCMITLKMQIQRTSLFFKMKLHINLKIECEFSLSSSWTSSVWEISSW